MLLYWKSNLGPSALKGLFYLLPYRMRYNTTFLICRSIVLCVWTGAHSLKHGAWGAFRLTAASQEPSQGLSLNSWAGGLPKPVYLRRFGLRLGLESSTKACRLALSKSTKKYYMNDPALQFHFCLGFIQIFLREESTSPSNLPFSWHFKAFNCVQLKNLV